MNPREPFPHPPRSPDTRLSPFAEDWNMGKGLLLWLIGIPIPIIILVWLLGGLH